jgi:hypothetical protein
MKTHFLGVRKPTSYEADNQLCDVVFMREDDKGRIRNVFATLPTKDCGFFQWGEEENILIDNLTDLEDYINKKFGITKS